MAEDTTQRLRQVQADLLRMGRAVESRLQRVLKALAALDADAARAIAEADAETDRQEVAVERACLDLLAAAGRAKVDTDAVVACLKFNIDLERAGDNVKNLAERVPILGSLGAGPPPDQIGHMGRIAGEMLTDALDAVGRRDTVLAGRVIQRDDAVDVLMEEVYRALLDDIAGRPEGLEAGLHHLTIAKTIERVADHAAGIARNVVFMVTGKIVRHV
jgi:phosphate transport system protein